MSKESGEKGMGAVSTAKDRIDPLQQQREALEFANRSKALNSEFEHLPDTALHSAQSFYLSRNDGAFIADSPFRLQPDQKRYSVGYAISRLLVASVPKYAKVREELSDSELSIEHSINELKSALGAMFQYSLIRSNKELKKEDFEFFKSNFLAKITPDLIGEVVKEAARRYTHNKKEEANALETAVKNSKSGSEPGLTHPQAPDDFSLMQRSFTEALFEKLHLEDGTDISSFIHRVTGGTVQKVIPTGLWRDRGIQNAIVSTDDSVDVASKRNEVESFLTNLPRLAVEAIDGRSDLSEEQKMRVRIAAEILYSRADQLRTDRLKTIDRKSAASETADLNRRAAAAYGTLFKLGVLPPLREPLDIDNKRYRESVAAYNQRVKDAIVKQNRQKQIATRKFIEERKKIIVDHLLAFMDRLDANENMDRIFPGTLGSVLSATGESGRKLYGKLRVLIESRAPEARFKNDTKPTPRVTDTRPYAVLDETTGKTMIPPPQMVQALDASYKAIAQDISLLRRVGEQIRTAQFEILSSKVDDLITLAKRLDVLEADLHISDIRVHLADARQAIQFGGSRGEPGSLKWRSTADLRSQISGLEYAISESLTLVMRTRKTLLLKLIDATRAQMQAAPKGTDFGKLAEVLTEYELLARREKTNMEELSSAINFFITE